jgi:hypothetical protein
VPPLGDLRIADPVDCGYVAATQAAYMELARVLLKIGRGPSAV